MFEQIVSQYDFFSFSENNSNVRPAFLLSGSLFEIVAFYGGE